MLLQQSMARGCLRVFVARPEPKGREMLMDQLPALCGVGDINDQEFADLTKQEILAGRFVRRQRACGEGKDTSLAEAMEAAMRTRREEP
jgi:hypothetical protein